MATSAQQPIILELTAVILAVGGEEPRLLTVQQQDPLGLEASSQGKGSKGRAPAAESGGLVTSRLAALPSGLFSPSEHRTLELGLRHFVQRQTGLELGYVEQLYTFGNRNRDPRETLSGSRVVSVAYLALVRESLPSEAAAKAEWMPWYHFLPWEDWRSSKPQVLTGEVQRALNSWATSAPAADERRLRQDRIFVNFGFDSCPWDPERALDRFELLYEAGLVEESSRDTINPPASRAPAHGADLQCGNAMAYDHRRIISSALSRLRGKLSYRPVVFELLPAKFTLFQLQQVVEALTGTLVHKQNFRRLVERGGLVEATGEKLAQTGGRPAELFRFRAQVVRERPAPGVGLPGATR